MISPDDTICVECCAPCGDEATDAEGRCAQCAPPDQPEPCNCDQALELQQHVTTLRKRLRHTAQILVEAVGAEGPTDAETSARRAAAKVAELTARLAEPGLLPVSSRVELSGPTGSGHYDVSAHGDGFSVSREDLAGLTQRAIALLAVDQHNVCWHCGDMLEPELRPHCERCSGECDVEGCEAPGCNPPAATHAPLPRRAWLNELLAALGWQGGTIHDALQEVKRLATVEAAVHEVREFYPEDVFPPPRDEPMPTGPDRYAAAGARLACDEILRRLRA